jgi:glycosyltransferase involved in cell wall biosynthesis
MSCKPCTTCKPVNLHLAHSWGGGLGSWVKQFADADVYSENLILESFGPLECYGIGLRLRHARSGELIDSWVLQDPITDCRSFHSEQAAILEKICCDLSIDHIYVSSLIGHSYEVFRRGVPVTMVYHDYSAYCPGLFIYRDGICTTCNADDLRLCRSSNISHPPKNSPQYYLELRDQLFKAIGDAKVCHISPSRSVPVNLSRLEPRFKSFDFNIIEHGIRLHRQDFFGGADDGRRLRVGMLGNLLWYKGLEQMLEHFDTARTIVDLHFIGAHDAGAGLAERWGSIYIHEYSQNELPEILDRYRLDLILFLPLVPESFSYTLSEAWCFCIPPASLPVGALADRITDGINGFHLGRERHALIDFLLSVNRERDRLRKVAANLREQPVRTVDDAIKDYYRLRHDYPRLLNRSLDRAEIMWQEELGSTAGESVEQKK